MSTTFLLDLFLFFPLVSPSYAAGLALKVQETYRQTETLQADFVQKTFIEVLEREVEERGRFVFSRPGRFMIRYEGTNPRRFISDGKTLWIERSDEKEVEVYENVEDLVSREALVFLGGLGEMTREFRVTESGKDEIVLVPRKKGSLFAKLILRIDDDSLVREATLFPRSGNRSHYRFLSVERNRPVPAGTFRHP